MSQKTKQNDLIGRPVCINFACRWQDCSEQFRDSERAQYEKRRDWNKAGVIVDWDTNTLQARVLLESGRTQEYYIGELTITGPAPDPAAELLKALKDIGEQLDTLGAISTRLDDLAADVAAIRVKID